MPIEEPKFIRSFKHGAFELRDYAPTIVAEVHVTGDQNIASRKGFQLLADYIFGANKREQKISMTAPVAAIRTGELIAMNAPVLQIGAEDNWLVRFTLPARYALDDLPVPDNPVMQLKTVAAAQYAVVQFSGLAKEENVATQTTRLMAGVTAQGLSPVGPVALALQSALDAMVLASQ